MSEEQASVPSKAPSSSVITLRAPKTAAGDTTTSGSGSSTFEPPSIAWLQGTWHVTHSTNSSYKKSRNVTITFKALGEGPNPPMDDITEFQGLSSDQVQTVEGVDTPAGPGGWNFRGKGWLNLLACYWEILGYGREEGEDGERWMVTYFTNTIITAAGIEIYSRRKEGLKEETVQAIEQALGKVESEVTRKLVGELFEVSTGSRTPPNW